MYSGSRLRWHLRPVRRLLHEPICRYRHHAFAPTDVVIASYPRSGSTWLTMMLAELVTAEDLGFGALDELVPTVDRLRHSPGDRRNGRGLVRTHERRRPEYRRSVYVVRDVRDVVVSYFHYRRWLGEYRGDLERFVRMFLSGRVDSYGTWMAHVRSWLPDPGPSTLIVRFEDLRADPAAVLGRLAAFVGAGEVSPAAVQAVVERNAVAGMRAKEVSAFGDRSAASGSRFVREGAAGGWRDVLTPVSVELVEREAGDAMRQAGYA